MGRQWVSLGECERREPRLGLGWAVRWEPQPAIWLWVPGPPKAERGEVQREWLLGAGYT